MALSMVIDGRDTHAENSRRSPMSIRQVIARASRLQFHFPARH
jgi:hypothetical protein